MYEFMSSGILYTNHINCRDQLCVNLDIGELIQINGFCGNHLYEFTCFDHIIR